MRKVFNKFGSTLISALDTVTQSTMILNHLARGGVHRAYVVESKSEQAAAISEVRGQTLLAIEFSEAQEERKNINPGAFEAADAFMREFRNRRKETENSFIPDPIRVKQTGESTIKLNTSH